MRNMSGYFLEMVEQMWLTLSDRKENKMGNINGYYLDMIEQMGFKLSDRNENRVIVYDDNKKIGAIKQNKPSFAYREKRRDGRRIAIYNNGHSEFINNSKGFLVTMDTSSEFSALMNILRIGIMSLQTHNIVKIEFDLIPPSISMVKGEKLFEINVWVSKPDENVIVKGFFFRLYPKYGEIYVNNYYQDNECCKIPSKECTSETISERIVDYINHTELASDSQIQDGLKTSLPVIGKCISHLLDFFRGFINDDLIDPIFFKGFTSDDQIGKGGK